jgi:hypothetical protein
MSRSLYGPSGRHPYSPRRESTGGALIPGLDAPDGEARGETRPRRPHTRSGQRAELLTTALAFAIPCAIWMEIQIVGRLFVTEIALLCILPLLLLGGGRMLGRELPRKFLIYGACWLLAQVATDIVRHTPQEDYLRGWAKILFTLSNFAALMLLLRFNERRICAFASGIAVGRLLGYVIEPGELARYYPWKFGIGYPITLLFVLTAQHLRNTGRPRAANSILLMAALMNIAMGYRSLGLICFLVIGYLMAARYIAVQRQNAGTRRLVLLGIGLAIPVYASVEIYTYAATTGRLGEEARQKYEQQSGGDFGLLIGGRQEILGSSQAIIDSPLLGHGSWAKNPEYVDLMFDRLASLGYTITGTRDETGLIPSHSYLLGAWVESGIVGALFWVWVAVVIGRSLLRTLRLPGRLAPLGAFVGVGTLWDVLFSPFGAEQRLYLTFAMVLAIYLLNQKGDARLHSLREQKIAAPQ